MPTPCRSDLAIWSAVFFSSLRTILRKAASRPVWRATTSAERFAAEDVPFARARKLTELHEDPQIAHNQVFSTIEHPAAGTLRQARPAPRFGRTPAAPGAPAPVSGQHTREILAEIGLGERTEDWLARGIVAAAE